MDVFGLRAQPLTMLRSVAGTPPAVAERVKRSQRVRGTELKTVMMQERALLLCDKFITSECQPPLIAAPRGGEAT